MRLGANTLHSASAACPKRRVRRRTVTRPPRAQTARAQRRPGKEKGSFEENAPPGPSPPHAASRTLFRTKKSVRSDAHYVGRTGLRLSPVRQGGALARFARLAARCRPSQPRRCRRVVRIGANTLHGASAACSKRRVRRRTVTRPPSAKLPVPPRRPDKGKGSFAKTLRLDHPHRTRHPEHFSEQRKVSVLMRTTWGGPGSASAGWCFPDLNQKASEAGRRSGRFCPVLRPVPAEPAAALPPRSAPRSEHAARCECSVSETTRAAADGDAATQRKAAHIPAPPGEREEQL